MLFPVPGGCHKHDCSVDYIVVLGKLVNEILWWIMIIMIVSSPEVLLTESALHLRSSDRNSVS